MPPLRHLFSATHRATTPISSCISIYLSVYTRISILDTTIDDYWPCPPPVSLQRYTQGCSCWRPRYQYLAAYLYIHISVYMCIYFRYGYWYYRPIPPSCIFSALNAGLQQLPTISIASCLSIYIYIYIYVHLYFDMAIDITDQFSPPVSSQR